MIASIETALPPFAAENADIARASRRWLEGSEESLELFLRFLSASHTERRHFVMPPDELLSIGGPAARAELFERFGPSLAREATEKALASAGIAAREIDALVFTSCTVPLIPALDTYLIQNAGFRPNILRIPSYQFGCAGGIMGLGIAQRFLAWPMKTVVVSTELCSLVFQPANHSPSHLVGAAIFGDGAAAAVISPEASCGLRMLAHESHLIASTRHLMGYDITDTGAHLRLDKELPAFLAHMVPTLVDDFLMRQKLRRDEIPWWLFHPGGSKILSCLTDIFELRPEQASWSKDVLRDVGNLSSAAILFVIDRFMRSRRGTRGEIVLIMGVGPGMTIELILASVETD